MRGRPEKRRAVWINDEDWAALGAKAKLRDISVSAYIRAATVGGGFITPEALVPEMRRIEREMDKPNALFQQFRPVPKPSQKR